MQPNGVSQKTVSGINGRSTVQSQEQQQLQHFDSSSFSARIEEIVYGYLRRNGYDQTAQALERESQTINEAAHRAHTNNRPIMINDRMFDLNLEQILQLYHKNGRFGVAQDLLEFGKDLHRMQTRFYSILNQASQSVPAKGTLHQQLYGKPSFSKHQQPPAIMTRPAPQARAQMELMKTNQIAEQIYRQQQQQQDQISMIPASNQMFNHQNIPSIPPPQQPAPPALELRQQLAEIYEEGELPPSSTSEGSSRRKPHHPQNLNTIVHGELVDPIMSMIKDRDPHDVLNMNFDIESMLDCIRPEFIEALDCNFDESTYNSERQGFNPVLEGPMSSSQYHIDGNSMTVQEEVVVVTQEETVQNLLEDGELFFPVAKSNFVPPEPLLSPLPKEMEFRKQSAVTMPRIATGSGSHFPSPKRTESDQSKRRENHSMERERKSNERSSKNTNSPHRLSEVKKTDDYGRHRKKEREYEKDKERDKSTNRDRDRRKTERKESHVSIESNSKAHHNSSSHNRSTNVQSDRESTPSTSSRTSEKDKMERLERKRARKENDKLMQQESSNNKEASDMLNKVRKSHAAGSSKNPSEMNPLLRPMESFNSSKRKSDEVTKKEFKIPKKNSSSSSSTKFEIKINSLTQSGPLIREPKPEKARSKTSTEIAQGDDRPEATHFINLKGHPARLTSILVNANSTYERVQKGGRADDDPQLSPDNSDPYVTSEEKRPENVQISNHPKGRSFAPIKGSMLNKIPKPSSSDDSSDEESSSKHNRSSSQEFSEASRSQSPEPKRHRHDSEQLRKLMDKIHGPK